MESFLQGKEHDGMIRWTTWEVMVRWRRESIEENDGGREKRERERERERGCCFIWFRE
jgi:hypothetical protein